MAGERIAAPLAFYRREDGKALVLVRCRECGWHLAKDDVPNAEVPEALAKLQNAADRHRCVSRGGAA